MSDDLPEGWALVTLPKVCAINPPKPPPDALSPDAIVTFVPMPAVDAEQGAITAPTTRHFSKVRKGFTAFRDEDVIIAKITPCMENGKAAIARHLLNGVGFGSTEFHVLRSAGAVIPEYHTMASFPRRQARAARQRAPRSSMVTLAGSGTAGGGVVWNSASPSPSILTFSQ